jgi:hypothetical protein
MRHPPDHRPLARGSSDRLSFAAALSERSFAVLDNSRPSATQMLLWQEHLDDGFRITLQCNDLGELLLIVTSPCVWPTP